MSLTISNYRELINMMFYLGTCTYKITRFKNPLLLILLLLTLYLTLQKSTKVVDLIPLSGESSCIFTQIFLSGKATRLSKLLAYLSEVTEVQAPMFTRQFLLYINHYLKDSREVR